MGWGILQKLQNRDSTLDRKFWCRWVLQEFQKIAVHGHHLIPQAKQSEPSLVGDEPHGIQTQGSGFKRVKTNLWNNHGKTKSWRRCVLLCTTTAYCKITYYNHSLTTQPSQIIKIIRWFVVSSEPFLKNTRYRWHSHHVDYISHVTDTYRI